MGELGYYRSKADPAVRLRHANGNITITSTYTDNTTGISSSKEEAECVKEELGWTYETKDLGDTNLILGIRIDRDWKAGTISISQRVYMEHVLDHFGMADCNPRGTPLPTGMVLTWDIAPITTEDCAFMANKPYQELLGSIMYTQIATWPNLSYAISTLSKFASNPGRTHWNALTHVLHYIKGTIEYMITYGRDNKDIWLIGYVDTDYSSNLDNRRSCSGHIFVQAGGPTSWGTQYQPTVALSTTEAKYMALTRVMK